MKTKSWKFYVGIGNLEHGDTLEKTKFLAVDLFGGATIYNTEGIWKSPSSGKVDMEKSLVIEILTDKPEWQMEAFADTLASIWDQEEVWYTSAELELKVGDRKAKCEFCGGGFTPEDPNMGSKDRDYHERCWNV
jgi:hypothetical protein